MVHRRPMSIWSAWYYPKWYFHWPRFLLTFGNAEIQQEIISSKNRQIADQNQHLSTGKGTNSYGIQTLRAFPTLHIQKRAFSSPETQRFSSWDRQYHALLQSLREILDLGEARNSLVVVQTIVPWSCHFLWSHTSTTWTSSISAVHWFYSRRKCVSV